jgi:hypothetical protein
MGNLFRTKKFRRGGNFFWAEAFRTGKSERFHKFLATGSRQLRRKTTHNWEQIQPELRDMMSKNDSEKSPASATATRAAKKPPAGKEDWIGAHLRKVYDEALSEPVPDRFLDLLKEIDRKERGS